MPTDIIIVKQQLNATIDVVWLALTSATQMKNWYFAMENFIAEPGFSFVMYGEKEGKYFPINCSIIEVKKNSLLSYSWNYEGFPSTTLVSFELLQNGPQTMLTLTHEGLKDIPKEATELYAANHIAGWKNIIKKSLKDFVEKKSTG